MVALLLRKVAVADSTTVKSPFEKPSMLSDYKFTGDCNGYCFNGGIHFRKQERN
jgi:hypothetical protein